MLKFMANISKLMKPIRAFRTSVINRQVANIAKRDPFFPKHSTVQKSIEFLEDTLQNDILKFWQPAVIDEKYGGYVLNYLHQGRWLSDRDKYATAQGRVVWFYANLAQSEYGTGEHLDMSKHGFEFLKERMWDDQNGGFYWSVDYQGKKITKDTKNMLAQCFSLYGLSEYVLAAKEPEAQDLAENLFTVIEKNAHDKENGGYLEEFSRDWQPLRIDKKASWGSSSRSKLIDIELHMLEAYAQFHHISPTILVKQRLYELILIQSNSVFRKEVGANSDLHTDNWIPLDTGGSDVVNYGHDLENMWLLTQAMESLELPMNVLIDYFRVIFDYVFEYGYDSIDKGIFYAGRFNQPAEHRKKTRWAQAEAMIAALKMYELTKDKKYWVFFTGLLDWCKNNLVDKEYGGWLIGRDEHGNILNGNQRRWKTPYHHGRAILKALKILKNTK